MTSAGVRGYTEHDAPADSIYNQCVRCGLCLPSCPTYLETLTETSGPRGRISLIKAVGEGELDLRSAGFVHQMSECLDCRACEAVCPSGVHYGQLVETARAQLQQAAPARSPGALMARYFGLRLLFSRLGFLRFAARLLRFYQRSGLQTLARRSGLLGALGLSKIESAAPRISERFFIPAGQHYTASASRMSVMLHAGCIMQVAFSEVHEATVEMLQRSRCNVVVPAAQGCCGAIAVHAGEIDLARELAKRNIETFEKSSADLYVVNAAGCGSALKEYGELFHDDPVWARRGHDFSAEVRDICELLWEIGIPSPTRAVIARATYQDACHLAHAQRITAQPRALLAGISGLELIDLPESSVCCGSAGIYNLTEPAMAARLQKRKIDNLLTTGADLVITANPGCAMQLRAGLKAAGSSMRVEHVVEVLNQAYA
ncbi:MAG: 4Fe-4S ferredoxin [Candidatus Meridianibacter frigidus]|nr:MAG: 4Fe-4S ferredoxin [Candidatus Eremiobacteraeota bacterium]